MTVSVFKSGDAVSHRHYDPISTIGALFLGQVGQSPDKSALIQDGTRVTYRELAQWAAAIAQSLHDAGVRRGDRVGLLAGRSVHTVAGQLGVMALGAAFVALDPGAPETSNLGIVKEAGPKAILYQPEHKTAAAKLGGQNCPVIALDLAVERSGADLRVLLGDSENRVEPDDLAYVIYTSGSTGRPKGVMVPHRGVCRLVRGQSYADLGPDQVMLNMAAVGFDANIGEIYSAILNGGTLSILPDITVSLDRIGEVIARDRVSIAYITAGLFHVIAEHRCEILAPLRQVFPCGDVLSETHVKTIRRVHPHLRMINGYGPTENTVFTCCFPIDDSWTGGPVPIGFGLEHDHLFVLDDALSPLPDGEIGQLAVGGAGIGIGYLGRPDLTAAAFVTLKTSGFVGRVYLTGDLVARGADGIIRFHGRLDRQIKINGQRVELDMVEHELRADRAVEDAVAVAATRPNGSRQIVAFVSAALSGAEPLVTVAAVLDRMRAMMPAAAVPSHVEIRDSLPLTMSGKIDRKRLAAEWAQNNEIRAPKTTPLSPREVIRQIWQDVLGREIQDDNRTFFDLGGTSLQLIAVHTQLQQRLGRSFAIARLFEAPRIRDLEHLLGGDAAKTGKDFGTEDPIAARRAAMALARSSRRKSR